MKTKLILSLISVIGILTVTSCYHRHSRGYSRGPAVGVAYAYVYYPDVEVYFEPRHHIYYWSDGGTWRSGPRVPHGITLRSHVTVNVDSPEPYRHHDEVRAQHPRHQQEEKHDRKDDDKRDRKHSDHDQQ